MLDEIAKTREQFKEMLKLSSQMMTQNLGNKIEEAKTSYEHYSKSIQFNINRYHDDVKETKEDVSYMKNKIEIFEKSQKVTQQAEASPTNYYQLVYKLLDIGLTLVTIILLAVTNAIASVKFVFMLYPRIIVILLLSYLVLFYMVDFEKLDIYFHRLLFKEQDFWSKSHSHTTTSNSNGSYVLNFLRNLYGLIFHFRDKSDLGGVASSSSNNFQSSI
jgi:hypothetical protein